MAKTIGLTFAPALETDAREAYACPHCGKEYKTDAGLRAHMEKEHPDNPHDIPCDGEGE